MGGAVSFETPDKGVCAGASTEDAQPPEMEKRRAGPCGFKWHCRLLIYSLFSAPLGPAECQLSSSWYQRPE